MKIIIDAYNFIKHVSKKTFITDNERKYWINTFQDYVNKRGNEVILVFDAGPGLYQVVESYGLVVVMYSGQSQTADDLIKKWLKQRAGQDILLVTSDREIRDFAHKVNIESIGSDDFHELFQQVMMHYEHHEQTVVKTLHKTTNTDSIELDRLMETGTRFLVQDEVEQAIVIPHKLRSNSKDSRTHRRLMRKLEKI